MQNKTRSKLRFRNKDQKNYRSSRKVRKNNKLDSIDLPGRVIIYPIDLSKSTEKQLRKNVREVILESFPEELVLAK